MLPRLVTDSSSGALLFVLFTALCFGLSDTATSGLVVPPDSQCACIGRELTYTCTAVGRGSTLWTGTAFDCTNNWINLRHSLFNDTGRGATGDCSGGAIVGESVGVTDNCYTSRLRVRIAADMNNKTIRCDHRPGTEINTIGQSTLAVITSPLPSPSDVHPVGLLQGNLTFQWTSVAPACSSNLEHRINSMSCGTCVLSSNTTATCYNVPQPMTTCSFSVQSTVCGDQVGEFSIPVEVTLEVPGVPHADIMPVYTVDGKISTAKIVIANNQTMYPYDGFSVPVSSYNISFSNSTSSVMLGSIDASPCEEVVCEYLPDLSTHCPSTGSIGIAVSAANELGVGVPSDPISIECTNSFVNVTYHMSSSSITCTFDDPQNTTGKLCIIEYGICKSQQMGERVEGSSTLESPNIVTLMLQSTDPSRMYCYNVTASNVSYTVIVMGRTGMDRGKTVNIGTIAAAVIVPVFMAVIAIIAALICVRYRCNNKQTNDNGHSSLLQQPVRRLTFSTKERTPTVEDKLQLCQLPDGRFKQYVIKSDCQLKRFLREEGLNFWRGCAYYEFHRDLEPNLFKGKRLLFMKEKEKLLYSSKLDPAALESLGENVLQPEGHRLFVQTTGPGTRHLPEGSLLLYDTQKESPSLTDEITLVKPQRLLSDWFTLRTVPDDCTLKEFQTEHNISSSKCNLFLEYDVAHGDRDILDILLVKKGTEMQQTTPELFTWPSLKEKSQDLEKLLKDWRVLIIKTVPFVEALLLKKGSIVLYERPNTNLDKEQFCVLKVKRDNTRMSSFIKQNIGSFENGRAFYEFTDEEDFLHYHEVVKVQKSQLKDINRLFIQPDVSLFYTIPRAPGIGLTPQKLRHVRVFIQSTSFGSRCLRAGETVLYKVDNEKQLKEVVAQV